MLGRCVHLMFFSSLLDILQETFTHCYFSGLLLVLGIYTHFLKISIRGVVGNTPASYSEHHSQNLGLLAIRNKSFDVSIHSFQ